MGGNAGGFVYLLSYQDKEIIIIVCLLEFSKEEMLALKYLALLANTKSRLNSYTAIRSEIIHHPTARELSQLPAVSLQTSLRC